METDCIGIRTVVATVRFAIDAFARAILSLAWGAVALAALKDAFTVLEMSVGLSEVDEPNPHAPL
jgi:hypothetical protein